MILSALKKIKEVKKSENILSHTNYIFFVFIRQFSRI